MRYVYAFEDGSKEQKYLLGGKGANLAEMTNLGLPVPPGFTITTDACKAYMAAGDQIPDGLMDEVATALATLEGKMNKRLGDPSDPLLVSVRSGAAFSMPGMMETVLNLGLNDESVGGLAQQTGNERFAWDSYRRFVQMFGKIVFDIDGKKFEDELDDVRRAEGVETDPELSAGALRGLVDRFKGIVQSEVGIVFPQDPQEQLRHAIEAVFRSWNGDKARVYRAHEGIPDDLGTAVNVQSMVFGNKGDDSGTGVAFTRNPATGEQQSYGDFLANAQGEDVVAGIRATESLDAMANDFPECHAQLVQVMEQLERHYRDMCDIEFTVEQGRLFMRQVRVGKRTAAAALKMASDMVDEGLIAQREAVTRITPDQLDQLLHPQFPADAKYESITKGLNASPGAAVGKVYFTADDAAERHAAGESVILVRPETSPDDVHGMVASEGILTSRGGLASHAALVARGWGKPAVCGASELDIDVEGGSFSVNGVTVRQGDVISINGTTGDVILGEVPVVVPEPTGPFEVILRWADEFARLGVRTNADTPEDALVARRFGARGIGLCRTEHMFLGERLPIVQRFILASGEAEENAALEELAKLQRADFEGIFEAMDGLPVTIRLLDPPLHEFLPDVEELLVRDARGGLDEESRHLLNAAQQWRESNPMLGTRGVRLGIIKPGLYTMQTKAILEAALARKRAGGDPQVEIMIPLIVAEAELELVDGWVRDVARDTFASSDNGHVDFLVGTMVETPRAALVADEIAEVAEFFSFGTNDLTQMTFGFSRDDIEGSFMGEYIERELLLANPFETLDVAGVGQLVRTAVERGRACRADLHLGICGEHGGDPASVAFFHEVGLDYVSCSPYRVPIARLAAAHAALGTGGPGSTA